MRISKTLLGALRQLIAGEAVAASRFRKDVADSLMAEGLLTVRTRQSKRLYVAINKSALKNFLASQYEEFRNMELSGMLANNEIASRSEQAVVTGNSKLVTVRSCPGFPVNSYEKIICRLDGREFIINPAEGSFLFITDWQSFLVPPDVVIIGVENMENFRLIRRQKLFFERYLKKCYQEGGKKVLFVSRYPQSMDLCKWLRSIPNDYLHFGDFDLAGIHIFLSEFHKYLGERASFLIPDDIESRIINGSVKRYNEQFEKYKKMSAAMPTLQNLINTINKYHRCYDQEGYIDLIRK